MMLETGDFWMRRFRQMAKAAIWAAVLVLLFYLYALPPEIFWKVMIIAVGAAFMDRLLDKYWPDPD
jgi:hypothetical protein